MRPRIIFAIAIAIAVALVAGHVTEAAEPALHLDVGDPARRDREVPVVLDGITDARSGEPIGVGALGEALSGARLVLVGESHTSHEFHRVQLQILEALVASGREVLLGLEMYPHTKQPLLDQWRRGLLTEEGFLELSGWYESWGYHWGYYRDIFLLARDRKMPIYALNVPREVVKAVRTEGFDQLDEEQRKLAPPRVDLDSDEHRRLFRAFFDDGDSLHGGMPEAQMEGMFAAQCTWDATMAYNASRALEGHPEGVLVVLVGSGHVAYGLGIERQAKEWLHGEVRSVVPVSIADDDDELVTTVRASYADFVWGVAAEDDPLYPVLGTSTTEIEDDEHRKVIYVAEESVAERSGFEVGDVLLRMDGVELLGRGPFGRLMATKRWGDGATFAVRRGEEEVEIPVVFQRAVPERLRPTEEAGAEAPEAP